MPMKCFRGAAEWALMVAFVFGAGAIAQAQNDEAENPVIQIGRDDAEESAPPSDELRGAPGQRPELPKHWVGLLFDEIGPDTALRAHVDIPEGQGLIVERVMPNSPAEKAGLKRHDILLRANDSELRDKHDLVELVIAQGEKGEQFTLEVLRRGQRETVYVTPEERPADVALPRGPGGEFGGREFGLPGGMELPQDLLREFVGPERFHFRQFGPGVILGDRGAGIANLPSGVSISVFKDGDQPPKVTVKRGEETWEVVGDDPKSLEQLPDDLRPIVEHMLRGGSGIGFRGPGQPPLPEFGDGRLRERLERMERQLNEMRERMLGAEDEPGDKAE